MTDTDKLIEAQHPAKLSLSFDIRIKFEDGNPDRFDKRGWIGK